MSVGPLKHMLQTNDAFVRECVRDLSEAESRQRPLDIGNSFHWVLGHMVVYRDAILELLGRPRLHPEAARVSFKRNADPQGGGSAEGGHEVAFETLVADFNTAGPQLQEALAEASSAQLQAAYNDKYSVEQRLVHLVWHEAYHVGQLGLLRRLAGKPRVV